MADANQGTEITAPLGRIVWGHPINPQFKTDQQTNQPVLNDKGEKIQQWAFGLAIPRADFEAVVWPAMYAEALKGYPSGAPQHFSWKFRDGDTGIDRKGKPYRDREGYAGHIVLTCTTELKAPGVFVFQNNAYRQLQPNEIKCGDYVSVGLNFKCNVPKNATHTPGLYVNPLTVLLVYEGDKIEGSGTVDPTTMYGQAPQQFAMPAGARPVGAGGPVGQVPPPGAGMPGMMPGQVPQQPMAPAPMQQPQQYQQPAPVAPQQQMPGNAVGGAAAPYPATPAASPSYAPPVQQMPPPATDFIPGAPQQPMQPAPMPGQYQQPQPGQMPGMPGPR
jgi:hypothetical protein